MSGPEKLFCLIAEREYSSIVSLLNTAIVLPIFSLRQLKSQINLFKELVLEANDVVLTEIENYVLAMIEARTAKAFSNLEEKRMAFCRAAFSCQAVMESMFPSNGSTDGSDDPVFVQSIPLSVRNTLRTFGSGFEDFEQYVCKLSLRSILDDFIGDWSEALEAQLDSILDSMGVNKIDELIAVYISKISSIMELLETLDKFTDCAFDSCNFTATALNLQEDTSDKIKMERQGTGWAFKVDSAIQSVYDQEASMRLRISNLRSQLRNINDSSSDLTTPDKVMR